VNLTALDVFNTSSVDASETFHFNIPPPRLTALSAKPSASEPLTIDLSWSFDHNNITDWRSYLIYRSETPFDKLGSGEVLVSNLRSDSSIKAFSDKSLTENITYYYSIIPEDTTGDRITTNLTNASSKSSSEAPPELPPPPITGVTAMDVPNATNSINLSWSPSTAYNLEAYRIYRSLSPFSILETDKILINSYNRTLPAFYVDDTVENNITYFYAVSAFSASALENKTSFELAWVVSIYNIENNQSDNKTEDPDDDIDIEIGDDTLYDSVIDMSFDVQSDLSDSISSSVQGADGDADLNGNDFEDTAGEFYSEHSFGEPDAINDGLIEIDAEPERINKTGPGVIVDDKPVDKPDDNKTDPQISDDKKTEDESSLASTLGPVIVWAWLIVLIITGIVALLYLLDKKRAGPVPEETEVTDLSDELEEE
jgi:hypothetical protein